MKRIFAVAILLCICTTTFAQSKENKWVIGVSGSIVNFGDAGASSPLKERFNLQLPKLNVTRYMFAGLSLEAGATLSFLNEIDGFYNNSFNYFSLDGNVRYDFNLSDKNLVPYIAIGGSIIGAPTEVLPSGKATATMNFSFGGTFWFSHHWGLNAQGTYKYSPEEYASMRSHTQISVGLVYSLNPRVLVYRLWDGRR